MTDFQELARESARELLQQQGIVEYAHIDCLDLSELTLPEKITLRYCRIDRIPALDNVVDVHICFEAVEFACPFFWEEKEIFCLLAFSNCTFQHDLHFRNTTFLEKIFFSHCLCEGQIDLNATIFEEQFSFRNCICFEKVFMDRCHFKKHAKFCETHFENPCSGAEAHFSELADFSEVVFQRDVNFSEIICHSFCFWERARFCQECNFTQANFFVEANFTKVAFLGVSEFANATFSEGAEFPEAIFGDEVNFCDAAFHGWADFCNCEFKEPAYFSRCTFATGADFSEAVFRSNSDFRRVNFHGDAHFYEGHFAKEWDGQQIAFHGHLDLRRVCFEGPIHLENIEFYGAVHIQNSHFQDLADFQNSTWHSGITISQSIFNKPIQCNNSDFKGTVTFSDSDFARVDMNRCKLHSRGMITSCTFNDHLFVKDSHFGDIVDFSHTVMKFPAHFDCTTFCKALTMEKCQFFQEAFFSQARFFANASFRDSRFHELLDLSRCKFEKFLDLREINCNEKIDFRNTQILGTVAFAGCNVSLMHLGKEQVAGKLASEQQRKFSQARSEYSFLKRIFEKQNLYEDMDWAYYKFKVYERKTLPHGLKHPLNSLRKAFSWIALDCGAGYGTQPLRITLLMFSIILLFALIYYIFPQQLLLDPIFVYDMEDFAFSEAFYISFVNFLGIGGEGIHYHLHGPMKYIMAMEGFLGIFIMTLFVATFTRKILRN